MRNPVAARREDTQYFEVWRNRTRNVDELRLRASRKRRLTSSMSIDSLGVSVIELLKSCCICRREKNFMVNAGAEEARHYLVLCSEGFPPVMRGFRTALQTSWIPKSALTYDSRCARRPIALTSRGKGRMNKMRAHRFTRHQAGGHSSGQRECEGLWDNRRPNSCRRQHKIYKSRSKRTSYMSLNELQGSC